MPPAPRPLGAHYIVVLPVHNEAESLPRVVTEIKASLGNLRVSIVAGLNACTDESSERLIEMGIPFAATAQIGYGHGCAVAIALAESAAIQPDAYLFVSADGANDPSDLLQLIQAHQRGARFVLGQRLCRLRNWPVLGPLQVAANALLGLWTTILTGRGFLDIGPLRLIDAALLRHMAPSERQYGWTIEAQVLACRLGAKIHTIKVAERSRLAGQQKVSGVSLWHSFRIGCAIMAAGWRAATRPIEVASVSCDTTTSTRRPSAHLT